MNEEITKKPPLSPEVKAKIGALDLSWAGDYHLPEPTVHHAEEPARKIYDHPTLAEAGDAERPSLKLVKAEPVEGALKKALSAVDDAITAARASFNSGLVAELQSLKEQIQIAGSPEAIQGLLSELSAMTNGAATDQNGPEQKVDALWGDIKKIDKDIDNDLDKLRASGAISEAEYERLKKEKEEAYKYPAGSEEWQHANDVYNKDAKATFERVEQQTPVGSQDNTTAAHGEGSVREREDKSAELFKAQQALDRDSTKTPAEVDASYQKALQAANEVSASERATVADLRRNPGDARAQAEATKLENVLQQRDQLMQDRQASAQQTNQKIQQDTAKTQAVADGTNLVDKESAAILAMTGASTETPNKIAHKDVSIADAHSASPNISQTSTSSNIQLG